MGVAVVTGATLLCTMGMGAGTLNATSQRTVLAEGRPAAVIRDAAPMVNVLPCGMCTSMANPVVASATAAALGVLTPQPCIPSTAGVWMPGAQVIAGGMPLVTLESKLTCVYGGSISIAAAGQSKVLI